MGMFDNNINPAQDRQQGHGPASAAPNTTTPSSSSPTAPQSQKIDFGDGETAAVQRESKADEAANVSNALNGDRDVSKEIEEEQRISDEDMKLVEEMLFKGWVIKSYDILAGRHSVEISTILPCEIDLMEEVLEDEAKLKEEDGGDVTTYYLGSRRKMLMIAISYRGMDKADFGPKAELKFDSLKAAVNRYNRILISGDLTELKKSKDMIKDIIKRRATALAATMTTTLSDIASLKRHDLDTLMITALGREGIVPKS